MSKSTYIIFYYLKFAVYSYICIDSLMLALHAGYTVLCLKVFGQ